MLLRRAREKALGAIRFYDYGSPVTKALAVVIFIVCILFLVIAFFPSIWVFFAGFKDIAEFRKSATLFPSTIDFAKYTTTWEQLDFAKYYLNSFISVAGSVFCAVVFNGSMAYVLGVLKPRGHKVVLALVMWSLLIPPTTSIVSLYVNIVRIGLNRSFIPLWLAMGANAFWVILFRQYFQSVPKEYFEAARVEGCTDFQVLLKILVPLSKPIIAVVSVFAVTAAWSDFLLPYLILNNTNLQTVMVRLFEFRTASKATDVDVLRAIVFSIVPPTVIFTVFQRLITQGIGAGGIKD